MLSFSPLPKFDEWIAKNPNAMIMMVWKSLCFFGSHDHGGTVDAPPDSGFVKWRYCF